VCQNLYIKIFKERVSKLKENKVLQIFNDNFCTALEDSITNGSPVLPWQKMLDGCTKNYVSERSYSGINALLLRSGFYLTFKQVEQLRAKNPEIKIKKGSKTHSVVYWNVKREDDNDPESEILYAAPRYYNVFRACDVENLPKKLVINTTPPEEAFANFMAGISHCLVEHVMGSASCYFNIRENSINLPNPEQFFNIYEYYMSAAHELIHSTGIPLGRFETGANEDMTREESYSFEELVATIGTHMLLQRLGVTIPEDSLNNDDAYARNWLTKIKSDSTLLFKAASAAQKAVDFLVPETDCEVVVEEENTETLSLA
jgi:antirestriction protein ArdC